MTHPKLTTQAVRQAAHEVVFDNPDKIVDTCSYADTFAPSCLVGHILHRLGWSVDELYELDCVDGLSGPMPILWLKNHGFVDLELNAGDYLAYLQNAQDGGQTWSRALEIAETRLRETSAE